MRNKRDGLAGLVTFMASERDREFAAFWQAYPRKVGKLDAIKAYTKARSLASAEAILAGVSAYIIHKPEYADWCHPATWLNQGRWMDEYEAEPPAKPQAVVPFHTRLEPQ